MELKIDKNIFCPRDGQLLAMNGASMRTRAIRSLNSSPISLTAIKNVIGESRHKSEEIIRDVYDKITICIYNREFEKMKNDENKPAKIHPRSRSFSELVSPREIPNIREFNIEKNSNANMSINEKCESGTMANLEKVAKSNTPRDDKSIYATRTSNILNILYFYSSRHSIFYGAWEDGEFILYLNGNKFHISREMIKTDKYYYPSRKIVPLPLYHSKLYKPLSIEEKYNIKKICLEIILCGLCVIAADKLCNTLLGVFELYYNIEYIYTSALDDHLLYLVCPECSRELVEYKITPRAVGGLTYCILL